MQVLATTNSAFPNRIVLVLSELTGPLAQTGPLAAFDPRRDLEVYVDGTQVPIRTAYFDSSLNVYVLFMDREINVTGVIQVVHHMSSPPFLDSLSTTLQGFAIMADANVGWGQDWAAFWGRGEFGS